MGRHGDTSVCVVRYTRYNLASRGKLLDTVRAIATFLNRFRVSSMYLGNKELNFRINWIEIERFISERLDNNSYAKCIC